MGTRLEAAAGVRDDVRARSRFPSLPSWLPLSAQSAQLSCFTGDTSVVSSASFARPACGRVAESSRNFERTDGARRFNEEVAVARANLDLSVDLIAPRSRADGHAIEQQNFQVEPG